MLRQVDELRHVLDVFVLPDPQWLLVVEVVQEEAHVIRIDKIVGAVNEVPALVWLLQVQLLVRIWWLGRVRVEADTSQKLNWRRDQRACCAAVTHIGL